MKRKILITGGAGFISSHLCEVLLSNGNKIFCVDNLSRGSKSNISKLLINKLFQFIEGDICNERLMSKLEKEKFDQIYHMASPASVDYAVEHPVETADSNSIGTKKLLELAKKNKAKLLFASSSEVYGDPQKHPQKESYWGNVNPIGIRSGYDEGKRFGEALCMAYHREYKVDTKIVRIFNTYGPNSNPHDSRIIPRFITQALRGDPITVHGDGLQSRSFCYVSDLVNGIVKMMESKETGPINLGNPEEIRVIEVANKIIKLTNSKSEIKFIKKLEDDPLKRKPDVTLAREKLKWSSHVSFDQGLDITIKYFKTII